MSEPSEPSLVFAYGSNLDFDQMKSRCPSARMAFQAALRHYRLGFTRESRKRGCGVAGLVSATAHLVWGVVYEISAADLNALDKHEGFDPARAKNSYSRRVASIERAGNPNDLVEVLVYFDTPQPSPPPPNAEYKRLILGGARSWKLPESYLAELDTIVTRG